jgi:hypothetical protein
MAFSRERLINNYIPDLRDNFRTDMPPPIATEALRNPLEAMPLVERLMPREERAALEAAARSLEPGEYRARIAVGSVEKGTRHPHDFVLDREDGSTSLYFVDPEHQMGKSTNRGFLLRNGDLRPKMSNLVAVRLAADSVIPDISVLRYRAVALSDPHLLKMGSQLEVAKLMLADTEIPEILREKENEITYRLNVRPDSMLIQSRYASTDDLHRFLQGGVSAKALEGKLHSYRVIMRHFLTHMAAGRFEPLNAEAQL